jgi:spermidine synthase
MKFSALAENRSGVIAVFPDRAEFGYLTNIVYSGGAYDGQFNTDMMHDSNGLVRAFAIAGLHPKPLKVLIIGLASGSWAQVLANCPGVDEVTIVEINPGFLPLIKQHDDVASLLQNPKVHIVIDDGRRWLVAHPDSKFDFVLMNTTFNWRANASNLLSTEFLRLIETHLKAGGVVYYNTTSSPRVLATGIAAFPYALRIYNFLAVSNSPLKLDKDQWRIPLTNYRIDGHLVFDLADPKQKAKLEEVLNLSNQMDVPNGWIESRESLVRRMHGVRQITDDNMGTEWP